MSKDEYDTCRLATAYGQPLTHQAKVVAVCDQPVGRQPRPPVTVTFRSFTPQPNGLEFKAGRDYYFITALIGADDEHTRFMPCRELNMRVIFKVCCKPNHRRPPLSAADTVITLRPSLAAAARPATVLPIEVLQPVAETQTSATPAPPPPTKRLLVPFDPAAPPDSLAKSAGERWSPTPLPPTALTRLRSAQQSSRSSLYQQSVWPHTGAQPKSKYSHLAQCSGNKTPMQTSSVCQFPFRLTGPAPRYVNTTASETLFAANHRVSKHRSCIRSMLAQLTHPRRLGAKISLAH